MGISSINKYMIPVRVRVEYNLNPDTGFSERVCYVECKNGELLTGSVPFSWAQYIVRELNGRTYAYDRVPIYENKPVAVLSIDGDPLEKTDSKVVGVSKGITQMQDNPIYVASIKNAGLKGEELFIQRWTQLPIDYPVNIACTYTTDRRKHYTLALCNAWILDLLYGLSIIKTKDNRTVKTMDGSRFATEGNDPHTIVVIRKWQV